jgi:hypothetical protein
MVKKKASKIKDILNKVCENTSNPLGIFLGLLSLSLVT